MIYIFGDSYCEPDIEKNFHFKKWYEQIGPVENYGKSGTGPEYSFEFFHDVLFNKIEEDDKIVFILSSAHRAKFPLEDVTKSYLSSNVLTGNIEHWEIEKQKENIKYYFDTRGSNIIFDNIKNLLYLKHISEKFKVKIYTFTVYNLSSVLKDTFVERDFSDNLDYYKDLNLYGNFISDFSIESSEYFDFYSIPLSKISFTQFLKSNYISFDELDKTLSNHLTEKNHNILADYINEKGNLNFEIFNPDDVQMRFIYE